MVYSRTKPLFKTCTHKLFCPDVQAESFYNLPIYVLSIWNLLYNKEIIKSLYITKFFINIKELCIVLKRKNIHVV